MMGKSAPNLPIIQNHFPPMVPGVNPWGGQDKRDTTPHPIFGVVK